MSRRRKAHLCLLCTQEAPGLRCEGHPHPPGLVLVASGTRNPPSEVQRPRCTCRPQEHTWGSAGMSRIPSVSPTQHAEGEPRVPDCGPADARAWAVDGGPGGTDPSVMDHLPSVGARPTAHKHASRKGPLVAPSAPSPVLWGSPCVPGLAWVQFGAISRAPRGSRSGGHRLRPLPDGPVLPEVTDWETLLPWKTAVWLTVPRVPSVLWGHPAPLPSPARPPSPRGHRSYRWSDAAPRTLLCQSRQGQWSFL